MSNLDDLRKTASSDLEQLGRVSHRVAMTDSLQLEKVLNLLLPRLLSRIGSNHDKTLNVSKLNKNTPEEREDLYVLKSSYEKIHAKLVEILGHIMKRVRADPKCKLPCEAVLNLLLSSSPDDEVDEAEASSIKKINPFTTIGVPRTSPEEMESLVPGLIKLLSRTNLSVISLPTSKNQVFQIAHLVLRAIEGIVVGSRTKFRDRNKSFVSRGLPSASLAGTKRQASIESENENGNSNMAKARILCASNPSVNAAIYDLLLDVLLYQTTTTSGSDLPPPGISKLGKDRLSSGASTVEKNWPAEFATNGRLKDLKLAVLDFIAPCRQWDLFNAAGKLGDGADASTSSSKQDVLGTARAVALMVVSSGDQHSDVSDRASSYLKAHMDSMRNKTKSNNSSDDENQLSPHSLSISLLGHPIILMSALLRLVLGDIVSDNILSKNKNDTDSYFRTTLGIFHDQDHNNCTSEEACNIDKAAVISTKRRMVSEKCANAILNFVASRILDDMPKIFTSSLMEQSHLQQEKLESSINIVCIVGSLVLCCSKKFAGNGRSLSGYSVTGTVGNSSVAATQLLNSLCARVVPFFDNCSKLMNDTQNRMIEQILAQCFAISCAVVKIASSAHSGNVTNSIGVEARDACYLVLSAISRSNLSNVEIIFNCGETTTNAQTSISINTASMLFGCLMNETETLKPRAIAALDSLLAAYCKLFEKSSSSNAKVENVVDILQSNPWLQTAHTTSGNHDPNESQMEFNFDRLSNSLQPLLWNAAQTTQPKASRHAAAKWAFKLLKPSDLISACHILSFVSGDKDVISASVAKDGLGLSYQLGDEIMITSNEGEEILTPDFAEFVKVVFSSDDTNISSWRPKYWDFSPRGQGVALRYGSMCLLSDLYGGDEEAVSIYLSRISETLQTFCVSSGPTRKDRDSIELLDEASICLACCCKTSQFARQAVVGKTSILSHEVIGELSLTVPSSKSRRYLASALGYLLEDISIWNCLVDGSFGGKEWVHHSTVEIIIKKCLKKLNSLSTDFFVVSEIHGAVFLGSTCIRALRLLADREKSHSEDIDNCMKCGSKILSALGNGLLHKDEVIGNACSNGISIALSCNNQKDAMVLNKLLSDGTYEALRLLSMALKKFGHGDLTDANRASSLSEAAGVILAATTVRESPDDVGKRVGAVRLECVEALFALLGSSSYRKDQEIGLIIGESLALYADSYSPMGASWSQPTQPRPANFESSYANELPPHAQVIYTVLERENKSNSPHKRNACAPVLLALVARVARISHKDSSYTKRALSLEIREHLVDIQMAFLSLLADPKSKQLARESCCIGLSACHGFSLATSLTSDTNHRDETKILNERLLKAFGQTTKHGGSAFMESRHQHAQRMRENGNEDQASAVSMMEDFGMESEVGGTAGLGEAALGAYREMANAAIMLDRPDILYSLMLLSVSLPVWTASTFRGLYSASSLLGSEGCSSGKTDEIKKALMPYLKNLIPRLLRACNDPNKQTREQMESLWIGITGGGSDARSLVNDHLLSTIDTLMEDATNKLWRARCGACNALAEIIVGRSFQDLGGGEAVALDDYPSKNSLTATSRLLLLFRVTVRSLDDVRLTVRESGESLSRSLRSLTIRLCDPKTSDPNDIDSSSPAAVASTVLPWLVRKGLNQSCQEAVGFAVSTILGIVEVAQPKTLQPVLPELIGSLLMAMSGLEPSALNYLQTRAAAQDSNRFEQLERLRLQMAQSGPISGALTKCLEMVKSIDSDVQKSAVVPQIDSALRCGAGFATRAAAADAVSMLCTQCPSVFKHAGTSTSNPTVRLLRALYYASEREQGTGARTKMIFAFGNLAALAPGSSVRSLALRLCQRYELATGSNDDPAARVAVATALRAISVRASNQFGDGGSNDIWVKKVLPLAYLGRNDKEAGSLFQEVWDEGGSVANMKENGPFAMQLQEKILPHLTKVLIGALDEVSWDRRVLACKCLDELCHKNILAPAPRSIHQDSFEDLRQRNLYRASSSKIILSTCVNLIVSSRVWVGKEDLVKTTATIAGNWMSQENVSGDDYEINPISKNGTIWDDLFVNDSWFKKTHESIIEENGDLNETMVKPSDVVENTKQISEEVAIDFSEGDKILLSEDNDDEEMMDSSSSYLVTYSGLCRILLEEGLQISPKARSKTFYSIDVLSYRAASLSALSHLLKSFQHAKYLRELYTKMAGPLIDIISSDSNDENDNIPPLIIARAMDCLGSSMWKGIQDDGENTFTKIDLLVKLFLKHCREKQIAWTIREASAIAATKLVFCAEGSALRRVEVLHDLISCSELCFKDKKFWKVRCEKLKILKFLCKRAGKDSNEMQLMLEALLPLKEKMTRVAKSSLTDSESKVTSVASEIISSMSWWP